MALGPLYLNLPVNTTVHVVGMTNSGSWRQDIITDVTGGGFNLQFWPGLGFQSNQFVGQRTIPASPNPRQLVVQMLHDRGLGAQASDMRAIYFNLGGLAGYIIGGQDSGGRPRGPAFWNTVAFVYFAFGY